MERISSRQNAAVKRFRELARARHAGDGVLLDGPHVVKEALSAGVPIDTIAFADPIRGNEMTALAAKAARSGARTLKVTPDVLAAMSPVRTPSGVVAIARLAPAPLSAVLRGPKHLLVVLHEVQDPGNVGATIRAAEGCGATGVIATSGTADPFGWKALRGAMGSAFRLPIAAEVTIDEVHNALRSASIAIVALVPRDGTPLPDADLKGSAALLLGGEGGGLSAGVTKVADARIRIPMSSHVESLNVAVAAGIVLYEAARQRTQ